eukprot:1808606-Rhodomonas_salina.1
MVHGEGPSDRPCPQKRLRSCQLPFRSALVGFQVGVCTGPRNMPQLWCRSRIPSLSWFLESRTSWSSCNLYVSADPPEWQGLRNDCGRARLQRCQVWPLTAVKATRVEQAAGAKGAKGRKGKEGEGRMGTYSASALLWWPAGKSSP